MSQKNKLQGVSVEYKVDFGNERRDGRALKLKPKKTVKRLPLVTRLLALAHHLQGLVDSGMVTDYADIARLSNLTRTRVTQIMNLTLLAPRIQEEILHFPKTVTATIKEQDLRAILKTAVWQEQYAIWEQMSVE
jgi:hypothetical protein